LDEDAERAHGDVGRSRPANDDAGASGDRRGAGATLLVVVVAAVVLVVFAALNFRPVRVNFLLFTTRARVVTVIVVAAALGFVVGWFVGRPSREERRHLRDWRATPGRGDERR
jgi:uncharacterized integral membrane protein